jgi:hypothetical protein
MSLSDMIAPSDLIALFSDMISSLKLLPSLIAPSEMIAPL